VQVHVLAFASVSDVLGTRETSVALPDGSSVADLKVLLEQAHPQLGPMWEGLAVAVNGTLEEDSRQLADDDEVALLPPVSGGSTGSATLVERPITVAEIVARVEHPGCGAVVLFAGNVRDDHQGRPVRAITYSAYKPMAEAQLERIQAELEAEGEAKRVAIVHRLGDLEVGETSVVIGVSSPHRASAYDVNRRALERLKAEVPIWKKEHYADGEERWREEESLVTKQPFQLQEE